MPVGTALRIDMLFLGCDPGITGAFAVLDHEGQFIHVDDLPVMRAGKLSWIDAEALVSDVLEILNGRPTVAYLERAQAMPKMGVSAMFNYGVGFGSLIASMQTVRARIEFVTPQTWKRTLMLGNVKGDSLDTARRLFPLAPLVRKKDHGRAEALLIANYGWKMHAAPPRRLTEEPCSLS